MALVPLVKEAQTILTAIADEQKMDIFKKIHVYGTKDMPLFKAAHIGKILGGNIKYKGNEGGYCGETELLKIRVARGSGTEEIGVFTELGLMRAIYYSDSEHAKAFRKFVLVAIKRLLITGHVSIEEAKADTLALEAKLALLQEENKKLQVKYDDADHFSKHYYDQHKFATKEIERLEMDIFNMSMEKAEKEAKHSITPIDPDIDRFRKICEKSSKLVYVFQCEPPAGSRNDPNLQYDLQETPDMDDTRLFYFSGRSELKDKFLVGKIYIMSPFDIKSLREKLTIFKFGKDMFKCTPDDIMSEVRLLRDTVIDDLPDDPDPKIWR